MQLRRQRREPAVSSLQDSPEGSREDSSLTMADLLPDDFVLTEGCEDREDRRQLQALLRTLDERERQVLLLRYGLAGTPPQTQQQTAARLGISRSYVSRLETRAVERLRAAFGQEPG